jgi:ArsR family transcriptional regulator
MKLKQTGIFFTALADGTRLRILSLLAEGELCVCDIMQVLGEPQSKVSRHLAFLRRSKLVTARRQGIWMHYGISGSGPRVHAAVLRALRENRASLPELARDLATYRRQKGRLSACRS